MDEKKVIKFKGKEKVEEVCKLNPLKLAPASKYIEKYYYEIIKDVFNYQMRREASLQEVHKLFEDERVLEGLKLYKEGKIKEGAVTDVDVRANVGGENGEYLITLKKWKPLDSNGNPKLIRHRYEIEEYVVDMFIDCSCTDHGIHHYKSNSALACKHICAVIWMLQEEYNMPKFFITPKEKEEDWYEKSKTLEIETGLYGVSMKQFQQFLNILVLRDFRGIPTSLAYSIHKEPNKGYEARYPKKIPPAWITFDNPETVEKLIKANISSYVEMLASRKNTEEQIKEAISKLIPTEEKDKRIKELEEECGNLTNKLSEVGLELEKLKGDWFKKLINKIKKWFE